jgi:hypothetical protein
VLLEERIVSQHAGAVENQVTSGITAPTEGRQKMTGAGNLMIDQAQKRENCQEGLNGAQQTVKK